MITQFFKYLLFLNGFSKTEAKNSLYKKQEPINLQGLNWTFIFIALAIIVFFVTVFVFGIGNEYPNELMNNL